MESRRVGRILAVVGGLFLLLAAVLDFLIFAANGIINRGNFGVSVRGATGVILEVVFAILILFFAAASGRRSGEMRVTGPIILIVLAVVVWVIIGTGLLPLLAGLFALLGGIVLLTSGR